jgi:rod shape-determining protein MreC
MMARAVRSGSRADTALVATCALLSLLATVLPVPIRESIASSLRRTVVAPLLSLQERAERARHSFLEREALTARVDSLALRVSQLHEMEGENDQLRRLLALGRQLQWGFVPAEAMHGQGIGDDYVLTLTLGSDAGVRPRAAVISPDGVVGQVTTVDPRTSQAIMWTHPDFRVSAMAADGNAFGIIRPHLGDEPERYLLELRGVAVRDTLRTGTVIATSGLGGVFPKGIPVGTVMGEINTSERWSRTYLVRPAVRPPDITNVMVLSPQRRSESFAAVWASAAGTDSALRRINAAGDSLARRAAAEAAARQRQMDSVAALLREAPRTPADSARADSVRRGLLPSRADTTRRVP